MSKEEIKAQFDSVVEQLNGELSTLPESVSPLVNLLIATFNMLFEITANQTDNLKVSINSLKQTIEQQTQTIEQQTQTIENLTRSNQKLVETQELKDEQILQFQELIKSLRTLLHSKNVDLDALRRLVFQGGREQKEQPAPQETTEKPQSKRKNSKTRERQNNKTKLDCCDIERTDFLDVNGNVLGASTREEATAKVPQQIERDGKKYVFKGWKECSDSRVITYTTKVKVTKYVPLYEEIREQESAPDAEAEHIAEQDSANRKTPAATIVGLNPEKDFLPKTVVGFDFMSEMIESRMMNRIPMNRIAQAVSDSLGFSITRQQLARYFIFASDWIEPAYQYLISKVLDNKVIHLDETFIHCQAEKNNRQYMIVFTSATGCFYHYANTRSQTVPFAILQNHFDGGNWVDNDGNTVIISTDGWYDVEWLKDDKGNFYAVLVGCMVHLRRYFWEVYDVHENHRKADSEDYRISEQIINLLKFIFHRDKECKTSEERTKIRKEGEVREKFDEIKKLVDECYKKMQKCKNPSDVYTAKFIKAVKYAYNQWEKFTRIMEDGDIPLDNSDAERSIRDFAVLRHSTASGFASVEGAKSTAVFSSFHETCKKHGVHLGEYLAYLFRYIGLHREKLTDPGIQPEERNAILEKAMPWNFKKV